MLAEINGKLGGNNVFRTDRLEDELTGDFFGTMRYMPYNVGLKNVFALAHGDAAFENLIKGISGDEFKFEFWKRNEDCEIDAYMEINNFCIGIEVKYGSEKSGADQLEREAKALIQWAAGREAILLYVAPQVTACAGYEEDKNKDCFKKVHLGYLCWEDVHDCLKNIKTDNYFEKIMLKDLCDLLRCKGLEVFKGFDINSELLVQNDLFFSFGDVSFVWSDGQLDITEDSVYEFSC